MDLVLVCHSHIRLTIVGGLRYFPRDDPASGVTVFCTHQDVGYIKVNRAVWGSPVVWGPGGPGRPGTAQKQARLGLARALALASLLQREN